MTVRACSQGQPPRDGMARRDAVNAAGRAKRAALSIDATFGGYPINKITRTQISEWVRAMATAVYCLGSRGRCVACQGDGTTSLPRAALHRLPAYVLIEAHGEWQVSDRRYLSEASMALLTPPVPIALQTRPTEEVLDTITAKTAQSSIT